MDQHPGKSSTARQQFRLFKRVKPPTREERGDEPEKRAKRKGWLQARLAGRTLRPDFKGKAMRETDSRRSDDSQPPIVGNETRPHPTPADCSSQLLGTIIPPAPPPPVLEEHHEAPIPTESQPQHAQHTVNSHAVLASQLPDPTVVVGGAAGLAHHTHDAVKPLLGMLQGAHYVSIENFNVTVASGSVTNVVVDNPRFSTRKYEDRGIEVIGAVLGTAAFFFF